MQSKSFHFPITAKAVNCPEAEMLLFFTSPFGLKKEVKTSHGVISYEIRGTQKYPRRDHKVKLFQTKIKIGHKT
jgi:hypothetical protein